MRYLKYAAAGMMTGCFLFAALVVAITILLAPLYLRGTMNDGTVFLIAAAWDFAWVGGAIGLLNASDPS